MTAMREVEARCPQCGSRQFDWLLLLESDTDINCTDCGYVSTVERAMETGRTVEAPIEGEPPPPIVHA